MLYLDSKLTKWLARRHKCGHRLAGNMLANQLRTTPRLFYHWQVGYTYFVKQLTRAV